jgi:HSP20 family protein
MRLGIGKKPAAPLPRLTPDQARRNQKTMNLLTKRNPLQTTRWDPFRELADFERGLERFFGRAPQAPGHGDEPISAAAWEPLTDITEDDKEYLVKAELPEVKREDVKVTVEEGVLRISGERKFEKEEKNKTYHRVERSYGSFLRAFTLPEGADATKVAADFKDGILMVHLPKTEKAKTKAVEVKVA